MGNSSNCFIFPSITALSLYSLILAVYDSDFTGNLARFYLPHYSHITRLQSPAHDLTDY